MISDFIRSGMYISPMVRKMLAYYIVVFSAVIWNYVIKKTTGEKTFHAEMKTDKELCSAGWESTREEQNHRAPDSGDLICSVSGTGHKVWAMKRGADLNASLAAISNSFKYVSI